MSVKRQQNFACTNQTHCAYQIPWQQHIRQNSWASLLNFDALDGQKSLYSHHQFLYAF